MKSGTIEKLAARGTVLASTRQSTAFNRTAIGVGDQNAFGRWAGRLPGRVFRLRVLVRCVAMMLLVAFAIIGPWGLLVALILWLVPAMA